MPEVAHPTTLQILAFEKSRGESAIPDHLATCRRCARIASRADRLLEGLRETVSTESAPEPSPSFGLGRLLERKRLSDEAWGLASGVLASADPASELAALGGSPARGYALVYTAQRGSLLAVRDPKSAAELAERLDEESSEGDTSPVAPSTIRAEAALLASQAELNLGRVDAAIDASERARALFRAAAPDPFGEALCDYFSANALSYRAEYRKARTLLDRALRVFAEHGQEHWMGRAEAGVGTLYAQQGRDTDSLSRFERAERLLDPELDSNSYAAALLNKASALAHLQRHDDARATYAQALAISQKHGFTVLTFAIRLGLAEIDFLRERYERALESYGKLAPEAEKLGLGEQALFASLYEAECQARLGKTAALAASLSRLRETVRPNAFQEPALAELFRCLDAGDLDAGLIEHVREALSDTSRPYLAYRRAG